MALAIDYKNLKVTAVVSLAAFLITKDMRLTLTLAGVNIAAGFLL